ncbi:hypothetical protein FRC06_009098, partial [Ceratobasidium sp. 370]
MSPKSIREIAPPPSSSPAPVRESQPQINSPTTTTRGTERHNALFDTPPPDTQVPELRRSDCSRTISSRGRDAVESTGKPLAGHSQAEPSQVKPAPTKSGTASASRSTNDQQTTKKPIKQALRFDNESSNDDSRITRTRPVVHQGMRDDSPPPRRPGGASSLARGDSGTAKHSIRIDADTARSLSKLLGVDTGSTTASAINETIKSLSSTHATQMESSQRYSQSLKRPASDLDISSPKHPRTDNQELGDFLHPPLPTPLPLPSFLERKVPSASSTQRAVVNAFESQHEPTRATHTTDRVRFGAGATPIPEPTVHFSRFFARPPSPAPRAITPEPQAAPCEPLALAPGPLSLSTSPEPHPLNPTIVQSSRRPRLLVPASWSPSPTPEPSPAKLVVTEAPRGHHTHAPASRPAPIPRSRRAEPTTTRIARADPPKRPQRRSPDTAMEPETEPELVLQPRSKKHAHPRYNSRHRSSRPGVASSTAASSTHRPQHMPPRHKPGMAPLKGQRDTRPTLKQPGKAADGDSSDEGYNSALDRAAKSLQQRPSQRRHRTTHRPSSPNHQPTHSSPRSQPGPSTCRHTRRPCTPDDDSLDSPPHSHRSTPADESDSPVDITRSGLGKYPGTRGKVASCAIPKLLSTATCKGIFQEYDTYIKWARNAYRQAWAQYYPHVPYKDPPLDLLHTIVLRISGLRTDVKKRLRALTQYLFEFENPGSSKRVRAAN